MGPLHGIRIIEFAGIGPGPHAAMLLADMGADVLKIERPSSDVGLKRPPQFNFVNRNRSSIVLDLKQPQSIELALDLIAKADGLIEGYRPGTLERLGLGPDICMQHNPRLVYGRITGYGQHGPMAMRAGHDLNYIAITGALDAIGRAGQAPTPPLNLVGDYGGAAYLVIGMLAAFIEAARSGQGQVIDAAMSDAASSLMTSTYGMHAAGLLTGQRGTNFLDSGAPYYDVYQCADDKWVSIAAIERKFMITLLTGLELDIAWADRAQDRRQWPALRTLLTDTFRKKTRQDWVEQLGDTDCCFAPVLSMEEAPLHPHMQARETFVPVQASYQPAPAPRFSRSTSNAPQAPEEHPGQDTQQVLQAWGYDPSQVAQLRATGALL